MLRLPLLTSRLRRGPLGVLFVLALAAPAAATLPPEGSVKLKEQWQSKETREAATALSKGQATPDNSNMAVIDTAAKWYAYRVTWPELQREALGMEKLVKELRAELESAAKSKPVTAAYLQLLTKKTVACLKEVLQKRDEAPIAHLNAARLLTVLAEQGYEEAVDGLADILEDNIQIDAVKYQALKGLKEFFALGHRSPSVAFTNKDREARATLAVIGFLERKPTFGPSITPSEMEAFRLVRREAVRALAQTRAPGVEVKGKLEGRTAQVLLNVVVGNLFPAPRLDERVAAAAGVMRLKSELTKSYQPDYAGRLVGLFLADFAVAYQQEKDAGRADKQPWKVYAAELGEALDAMKADTSASKTSGAYVAELHSKGASLMRTIESMGLANQVALRQWANTTPIKGTTVYEGVADSAIVVPPTGPEAEASEKPPEKPPETKK